MAGKKPKKESVSFEKLLERIEADAAEILRRLREDGKARAKLHEHVKQRVMAGRRDFCSRHEWADVGCCGESPSEPGTGEV